MTRTLAIVSHKPGVAKTTSAIFLASALFARGHRPLLVDADPGRSTLRWADLAAAAEDKFPWDVIGMSGKDPRELDRLLSPRIKAGRWDYVIIDVGQTEDHAPIARVAMRHADDWIMPMAPSGVEFDRAMTVRQMMRELEDAQVCARRWALLNRCNRRNPSRRGPDTQFRRHLTDLGFRVFRDQVENADDRYRQAFGTLVDAYTTPYIGIATELEETTSAQAH